MINNNMTTPQAEPSTEPSENVTQDHKTPVTDERSGIYVRAHVRIFDPESGVTYVNTSA
jgi:hypothetical protein